MEDDAEYTQVSVSQRMVDKPCTTLRPDHNYSASGRTSGKVKMQLWRYSSHKLLICAYGCTGQPLTAPAAHAPGFQ